MRKFISLVCLVAAAAGCGTPEGSDSVTPDSVDPMGIPNLPAGGLFGVTSIMTSMTPDQAITAWEKATGRTVMSRKWYGGQSPGNGDPADFPTTPDDKIQSCIDNNMTCFLCYRPAFNPPSMADYAALNKSLASLKAHGLSKAKVILYQEVEHQGLTPAEYLEALHFYRGAITSVYPKSLYHDAAGSEHAKWASFFPSSTLVDGAGVDYYAPVFAGGTKLDAFIQLSKSAGVPFLGTFEMGVSVLNEVPPADSVIQEYLTYLQSVAAANPGGAYMWYQQDNRNVHNLIPGYASGQDGGPNCVPGLQKLSDIVTRPFHPWP
jgi:hypothetical protein